MTGSKNLLEVLNIAIKHYTPPATKSDCVQWNAIFQNKGPWLTFVQIWKKSIMIFRHEPSRPFGTFFNVSQVFLYGLTKRFLTIEDKRIKGGKCQNGFQKRHLSIMLYIFTTPLPPLWPWNDWKGIMILKSYYATTCFGLKIVKLDCCPKCYFRQKQKNQINNNTT